MDSLRTRATRIGNQLNSPSNPHATLLRLVWSILRTTRDLVKERRAVFLWWSPGLGLWLHRWPEGRAADVRWWRTAHAWATEGGMHDMNDLLWRHYAPKAGDVVLDIGAGHGGETFFLAPMVGPTGRVLAVEAAPAPFRRLSDLVCRNGWRNVILEEVALSDRAGTVSISGDENWITGNIYDGTGTVQVEAVTLDELCTKHGIDHIDWLKMNIEGAEREAVRGMERMAPNIRHLTISCHDFLGTEWGRSKVVVIEWLTGHGFEVIEHGPGPAWAEDYVYAHREGISADET